MLQYNEESAGCEYGENKINGKFLQEETVVSLFWLMNIHRYYHITSNYEKPNQNKANVCKPWFERSNYYNKCYENNLNTRNS